MSQTVNYNLVVGKGVAVAGDDSAGYIDIATNAKWAGALVSCTIIRSGKILSSDPAITLNQGAGGTVRVGDGSSYAVTANDIIAVTVVEKPL